MDILTDDRADCQNNLLLYFLCNSLPKRQKHWQAPNARHIAKTKYILSEKDIRCISSSLTTIINYWFYIFWQLARKNGFEELDFGMHGLSFLLPLSFVRQLAAGSSSCWRCIMQSDSCILRHKRRDEINQSLTVLARKAEKTLNYEPWLEEWTH